MPRDMWRQGDVLVELIEGLPADAVEQFDKKRIVLAYGEVTGHAHAIPATAATRYEWQGDTLIVVHEPTALKHEEHGKIALAPGVYRKIQQREYSPEAIRNVAD